MQRLYDGFREKQTEWKTNNIQDAISDFRDPIFDFRHNAKAEFLIAYPIFFWVSALTICLPTANHKLSFYFFFHISRLTGLPSFTFLGGS